MYMVRKPDGQLTKDYGEILNVQYDFYKDLYTSNVSVKFELRNELNIKISEQKRLEFEAFITKDELFDGLMTLKLNRCPGIDGISLDYYRRFYKNLIDPYYAMLLQAYQEGCLSNSAKRGVICLIPKSSHDVTKVESWRPLTMLNYDYKIYAKAIANRLDSVMDEIVGPEQNGFIKG